jgi:hypothetical protein
MPVTAEVEIGGTVKRGTAKGELTAYVTDGPCWQAASRSFGSVKPQPDGGFFIEVFVPQGTKLWVCAANADGTMSGQADKSPLEGRGVGEVNFSGITVALQKAKKVAPPAPRIAPPK